MNPLRTVLLDLDMNYLRAAERFLSAKRDIRVLAALSDGKEGLRLIRRERPDIVILGLVLTGIDGFGVLRELCRLGKPPLVIVCTELFSEASVKIARKYGAAYYLCRPIDLKCLYRAMLDSFQYACPEPQASGLSGEAASPSPAELRRLLSNLGITPTRAGCQYLCEAITAVLQTPSRLDNLTRGLYAEIASKHRVSIASVERCIRSAICAAYAAGNDLFPLPHCPSNKEFIQYVAEQVDIARESAGLWQSDLTSRPVL